MQKAPNHNIVFFLFESKFIGYPAECAPTSQNARFTAVEVNSFAFHFRFIFIYRKRSRLSKIDAAIIDLVLASFRTESRKLF